MTDLNLRGKVAVVTGSARGWGKGIALELATRGVKVVVNGTQSETVNATCEEIRQLGGECLGMAADLARTDAPARLVDAAVEHFGHIDILVNNAGRLSPAPLLDMTDEQWDAVLAVQLTAQFRASRQAARHMVTQGRGGRIINMAGGGGFTGLFHNANHCASKGGAMAATLTWAVELAPHRITVNAVSGAIDTDQVRGYLDKIREGLRAAGKKSDLSARDLGSYPPEEAAAIVVFLASEAAANVSGQFFETVGPMVAQWRMANIVRSWHRTPRWTPESLAETTLASLASGPLSIEPSHAANAVVAMRE